MLGINRLRDAIASTKDICTKEGESEMRHTALTESGRRILLDYIDACIPFVFHSPNFSKGLPEDIPFSAATFDAPFRVFSIEFADSIGFSLGSGPDYEGLRLFCLMVVEVSPCTFKYYGCGVKNNRGDQFMGDLTGFDFAKDIAAAMVKRVNSEAIGKDPVNQSIRYWVGDEKRKHKISYVVHVHPKQEVKPEKSSEGRTIDWSHRFFVRGHWRTIRGIGKDRADNYNIKGFTWVTEHIRGDADLPLIKKTYVVDGVSDDGNASKQSS